MNKYIRVCMIALATTSINQSSAMTLDLIPDSYDEPLRKVATQGDLDLPKGIEGSVLQRIKASLDSKNELGEAVAAFKDLQKQDKEIAAIGESEDVAEFIMKNLSARLNQEGDVDDVDADFPKYILEEVRRAKIITVASELRTSGAFAWLKNKVNMKAKDVKSKDDQDRWRYNCAASEKLGHLITGMSRVSAEKRTSFFNRISFLLQAGAEPAHHSMVNALKDFSVFELLLPHYKNINEVDIATHGTILDHALGLQELYEPRGIKRKIAFEAQYRMGFHGRSEQEKAQILSEMEKNMLAEQASILKNVEPAIALLKEKGAKTSAEVPEYKGMPYSLPM